MNARLQSLADRLADDGWTSAHVVDGMVPTVEIDLPAFQPHPTSAYAWPAVTIIVSDADEGGYNVSPVTTDGDTLRWWFAVPESNLNNAVAAARECQAMPRDQYSDTPIRWANAVPVKWSQA